jgi:2-polyprenyl-3-methyl-5-hydroxy-6-metoxy-1,4-benzoquinol methylase
VPSNAALWTTARLSALADGTLLSTLAATGPDDLPAVLEAALGLENPLDIATVLDAMWRTHPTSLVPLAGIVQVAPLLPVDHLEDWSGRLRVRGLGQLCPLMARAADTERPVSERLEAARAAWALYFEDAEAAAVKELGGALPDTVPLYYRSTRLEVVERIPLDARRILELGCAAGRLGLVVKHRQPATVIGVERDEAAAAVAREVLDDVLVVDLDQDDLGDLGGDFDAIVTADVLEHIQDPWGLCTRLAGLLSPGGVLVASIPNIANLGVLCDLVEGRFDYAESGILDRTHLRFFTRASAVALLEGAGLEILSVENIADPLLPPFSTTPGPNGYTLTSERFRFTDLDPQLTVDLTTAQFLIVARKAFRTLAGP